MQQKTCKKQGGHVHPREINDHKRNQKNATKVGFEPRAANHYIVWMDFTIFISVVTEIMEYFIGYLEMRVTGSPIGYSEVPWSELPPFPTATRSEFPTGWGLPATIGRDRHSIDDCPHPHRVE